MLVAAGMALHHVAGAVPYVTAALGLVALAIVLIGIRVLIWLAFETS